MLSYKEQVERATNFLKPLLKTIPKTAIFTGTGLGKIAKSINIDTDIDYKDIPNFPVSTVESHHGKFVAGIMNKTSVVMLCGRVHLYEGYSPKEITFPIRVLRNLGIKNLIVTNASGGLNSKFKIGNIMLISDHINLTGANPLIGHNIDEWGIRFPDMTSAYDKKLSSFAQKAAAELGVVLKNGVYAGLLGPSLETPAEINFLRMIGADAVGLSTIQEVISAVHAGFSVLGLSIISNIADPNNPVPATIEEIIEASNRTAPIIEAIIEKIVSKTDDR
mmetsp:Transcript_9987/g.5198  ORF Transcript_9987/g.5198 Transcript_9987/m.5198 type:complete len:277 (-) Transcript_9987:2220-3050(-)